MSMSLEILNISLRNFEEASIYFQMLSLIFKTSLSFQDFY